MKLAITICATETYAIALKEQARRVVSNILNSRFTEGKVILVGDNSQIVKDAATYYKGILPAYIEVYHDGRFKGINTHERKSNTAIEKEGHLAIAAMRTASFDIAKLYNPDYTWTLDSDVLPPRNSLSCMNTMLEFDDGFYDVATCPYPNYEFIGGRGTPHRPILPDVYEDEREVPKELKEKIDKTKKRLDEIGNPDNQEKAKEIEVLIETLRKLDEEIKQCKPLGNVWELNAKQWRRRGWLSSAYPAIGLGSIVPSDWCGFGCNLLSEKALESACFDGYDGGGTEDLYCIWHYWRPQNIRICAIPHCVCDHVKKNLDKDKKSEFIILQSYHETEGECVGHLRMRVKPFKFQ